MPVVNFHIVWPDQTEAKCYSPSSTIKEYLTEGKTYPLEEFMDLVRDGLNAASERVRAVYGYACSSAQDQLEILEHDSIKFKEMTDAKVLVIKFS